MSYTELKPKKLKTIAKKNAEKLFNNIDDPEDRFNSELVYTRKPRTKSTDFDDYPFIHIDGVNIINTDSSTDGTAVEFTVDIEIHVWGSEETDEDVQKTDEIIDQAIYLLTGPEKAVLAQEAGMTEPNIIRNVDFTGIEEKDQPVTRQEIEFRTDIHKIMEG